MTQLVTTILVDSNHLFREGLRHILSTTPFRATRVVSTIDELSQHSVQVARTALFLFGAKDRATAVSGIDRIKAMNPTARIVVLRDQYDQEGAVLLLRRGANGYLLKQISCDALIKALDLVMLGVSILAANHHASDSDDARVDVSPDIAPPASVIEIAPEFRRLSDRETGILQSLMRGDANKKIGRELGITEATVKVHIRAILRKIRVRNRTQAAVWAHTNLLAPPNAAVASLLNGSRRGSTHVESI